MEASGAGIGIDGSDEAVVLDNGIVAASGIFEPGVTVELVERQREQMRREGGSVLGRRTVDENGVVGFTGLEPGALFWLCAYSDGRLLNVRVVAKDPTEAIVLFQAPVAPLTNTVGVAATKITPPPPAPPETPTDGTGLAPSAVSAAADAQAPTTGDPETRAAEAAAAASEATDVGAASSVEPGAADDTKSADATVPGASDDEPATYYIDTAGPDAPAIDPTYWALSGERVPSDAAVFALAPLYTYVPGGTPELPLVGWAAYTGPTEEIPAPVDDGTKAAVEDAATTVVAGGTSLPDDGLTEKVVDQAALAVTEASGTGAVTSDGTSSTAQSAESPADAPTDAAAQPAGETPAADAVSDATSEASATSTDTPSPAAAAEADPPTGSAAAPEVDQAAAEQSDSAKLLQQAEGLAVENANTLSDAELRQAITDKGATPVV